VQRVEAAQRLGARVPAAARELAIVAVLYAGYSAARSLAQGSLAPALTRALDLQRLEATLHLPGELWLNQLATTHMRMGLLADYWYASLHYVVTAAALLWLYWRGREVYVPARRALAVATLVALGFYLLLPTAPPRMLGGFTDVMALHSGSGWWGADASAPKGLGGLTNELAAFPSMHAGWALWVALAIWAGTASRTMRVLGLLYALGTAVVVVATANHWVVDVVIGQAIVLVAWYTAGPGRAWIARTRSPELEDQLRLAGSAEPVS
jgi:hypothetical protein